MTGGPSNAWHCRRRAWWIAVALALSATWSVSGAAAGPVSTVSVESRALGPVPFLFRAGLFLNEYPLGGPFETAFAALKPGAVHVMPLRDGADVRTLDEYTRRLPSFPSTRWAVEIHRRGGKAVIALTEVPVWLRRSKAADAYLRPPKDLEGWAGFVEANVRFFNGTLGLDAEYVLWDEPDSKQFWKGGTVQEYLALYRAFVLGARRADPKAKVGGPAVSWWGAKGEGSDGSKPMLYFFIRYCALTPLPELGLSRLPIDLLVWHQFHTGPKGDPFLYTIATRQIREWLSEFGYDPAATVLSNGSWNVWLNFGKDPNELSPERDQEFAAAFVVHALGAMDRAGLTQHTFFNLFESWQWESLPRPRRTKEFQEKEFFGGFGLLTRHGVIKPAFNAFEALGMLEGERLPVVSNDPYLTVLASRSADKLVLVLSNFTWPQEGRIVARIRMLLDGGYPLADLLGWAGAVTPPMAAELEAGKRSIDSLPIPDAAKRELNALASVDEWYRARNDPKTVRITVQSPPFQGRAMVRRFVIDERRANGFRAERAVAAAFARAQRQAAAQVVALLVDWGMAKPEAKAWDADRQTREIGALIARASAPRRKTVEDLVRRAADDMVGELNRSPEVGLRVSETTMIDVAPGRPLEVSSEMTPYSVQALVLTPTNEVGQSP